MPFILFVRHGFDGGIARHIADLETALQGHAHVLVLRPDRPAFVQLSGPGFELWFHAASEWKSLVGVLAGIGIDRVHFHHVDGMPREVLDLPAALGCPHDFTLHDYFPACANYHLADGQGLYCGADPGCSRCTDAAPAPWGLSVDTWRATFGPLLHSAARVIAPSHETARLIARFYPGLAPLVWPHPENAPRAIARPVRVMVPGAISPAKGLDVLAACIEDAMRRRLPLHFRVLGFTARPLPTWPRGPASVSGQFPEHRLDELFAQERGDVVFFPAQCAETFSYTLSDAIDTGLPIVATNLGALPERLAAYPLARVVDWKTPATELNEVLLTCASPSTPQPIARPRESPSSYRDRYLSGIVRDAGRALSLPPIDASWTARRGEDTQRMWTLAGLFEDAVLNGRASSAELLRARSAEADVDAGHLARARALLEQHGAERSRLEAELHEERVVAGAELAALRGDAKRLAERAEAAEASVRRMEDSRSWRLTAPLRALARLFKR